MSEETTKNFNGEESFQIRVLRELTAINGRLVSLEEKVDSRLRETRPIWEAVLTRLDIIESKVEGLALNLLDVRGEVERLKRRIPPLPPAA
jgi:tetrahydromethanopterin S-methyltransferase subunit G